ncbi:thiaminase II [Paenibacillus segetis]|uniref:Aminopyrimidine aminohydrolase n=1 Tax=Paenibacillus segetis TaxID=1325360 RepID=A0ABQ1YDA5_9BACL|nr:thiaminase II [Paenibacillus segetis]GGH21919.1 aminopyrimidine aminohydrolase [Paenibacillus segetis]
MMRFSERLYLSVESIREKFYVHPFTMELSEGTLSPDRFRYFLTQDYMYLIYSSKMFALFAMKAPDLETMSKFREMLHSSLIGEMELYRQYAERFNITREELEATQPAPTTLAFTKYMLDAANQGTFIEVLATMLPCLWSYCEMGTSLANFPVVLNNTIYRDWVLAYSSEEYVKLTEWCINLMDQLAQGKSEEELARLEEFFIITAKFHYKFWDMAYYQELWPV